MCNNKYGLFKAQFEHKFYQWLPILFVKSSPIVLFFHFNRRQQVKVLDFKLSEANIVQRVSEKTKTLMLNLRYLICPNTEAASFEGRFVTSMWWRMSKFEGSFKCGPQMRPSSKFVGRLRCILYSPPYPKTYCRPNECNNGGWSVRI